MMSKFGLILSMVLFGLGLIFVLPRLQSDSSNEMPSNEMSDCRRYKQMAQVFLHQRNYDGAIAAATKAISIDQSSGYTYLTRAKALIGLKRFDQAEEDASRAIELNPAHQDGYYWRMKIRQSLGDPKGALEDSNKIKTLK